MGEGNDRVTARAILPSVLTVYQRRWLTVTYLRLRKVGWFLVVAVLTAGLVAYFGTRGVAMPTAFGAAEPVQFWRLLVVVSGIVPALMMASPVAELEAVAGADFYRYRSTLLAASFLIVSALVLLGTSLVRGRRHSCGTNSSRAAGVVGLVAAVWSALRLGPQLGPALGCHQRHHLLGLRRRRKGLPLVGVHRAAH